MLFPLNLGHDGGQFLLSDHIQQWPIFVVRPHMMVANFCHQTTYDGDQFLLSDHIRQWSIFVVRPYDDCGQ
ncbi:2268_t:CDS:1, partial [Cetraspora pellucida]